MYDMLLEPIPGFSDERPDLLELSFAIRFSRRSTLRGMSLRLKPSLSMCGILSFTLQFVTLKAKAELHCWAICRAVELLQ